MYCTCVQFCILLFHIPWLIVSTVSNELLAAGPAVCGGEYRNVDAGEISSPVNASSVQVVCTWILSAPPGKKLLLNIENVLLSNNDHNAMFALYVDGEEIDVPRDCERCLSNVVGSILKVTLELIPRNFSEEENVTSIVNLTNSDVSFLIKYKNFNPNACEVPDSPSNGYFIEKGRNTGSKIKYVCLPPYELIGNSKSTCIITRESPVPVWEEKPPQCIIPSCNGRVLSRTAGKGMIVHPGYPEKTVLSGQHCEWHVRTDSSRRLVTNVKFFSLPLSEKKRKNGGSYLDLYDGSHDNLMVRLRGQESPRSMTTTSNHLILVLQTDNSTNLGNDASETFGFYIEYASTCEPLSAPVNGSLTSASVVIGANASFQCNNGFELKGEAVLFCLLDANWSALPPTCHSLDTNTTLGSNSVTFATNHATSLVDEYDDEGDDGDGPSTSTTSFSVMATELDPSPVGLVFSNVNESAASVTSVTATDSTSKAADSISTTARTTLTTADTVSTTAEGGHFAGKGNRKAEVPSHQDANAKSYITKMNKEEESGKSLSAGGQSDDVNRLNEKENHTQESVAFSDFMVILIASAVAVSVALGLVLMGVCLWYRKQYPVRMNFGRKFETFENPIYQTRGKKTSSSPPTVPDDPAELQRLTAARLSL